MATKTFSSRPGIGGNIQTVGANTPGTSGTGTSNAVGALFAVSAITGAFSAYEAGRMRQVAFEHEAAVSEINANQIKIQGMFTTADKTTDLANNLALQNVMAAASGRQIGEGSLKAIEDTSVSNLEADLKRLRVTGRAKEVATLMDSSTRRAAGKTAATQGLLSGVTQLTTGVAQASRFIS